MTGLTPVSRVVILRSNPVSPDPRVEKTAHILSEHGYAVEVVGWDRSGRMAGAIDREDFLLHLYRHAAAFGSGMNNLPALIGWQWFLLRWLFRNRHRYSILHACDFDTILPALWMKTLFGKKVVYDVFDFYADHIRNTPLWIKNLLRWLERRCITASDAVILVDEARKVQLGNAKTRRLEIIYNSPLDVKPISQPTSSDQSFRLAYVGLLVRERGFDELLSVLHRHPDWILELAGFGGDERLILDEAKQLPNVNWHGRVDYAEALHISASTDVLFALYDPSVPNHRLSSPNKLFEAMMLGKPVIVTQGTSMDQKVQDADCGFVVSYGDEQKLEQALVQLREDPILRQRLGQNARKAYDQNYSWAILSQRLLNLYQGVLSERGEQP